MMKQFALTSISAAVLATVSMNAQADLFQVEELPTADNYRSSFAQGMNAAGVVVGVSRYPTDLDIDLSQVSARVLANAGITDIEEVESLTQQQYDYILRNTTVNANGDYTQIQYAYNHGFINNGSTENLPVSVVSDTSVDSYLYSINSMNAVVGGITGAFEPVEFTYLNEAEEEVTETYFIRDYVSRGLWYLDGQSNEIAPPETAYLGGESLVMDINQANQAVGYASVAVSPLAEERIATCTPEGEDAVLTQPVEVCAQRIWIDLYSQSASNISPSPSNYSAQRSIYDIRGFIWQLDNNGEVISATELGTLDERKEDDDFDFSSYAFAINDNGTAVGQSWTYHPDFGAIRMPAIFVDEAASPVTELERYRWGAALDINNNEQAVGYVVENISGSLRNIGFIYDTDSAEMQTIPGFFNGSSTVPRAINSNGIIVGSGEIEATLSTVRRRAGFWYDSSDESASFVDLNDAVSCDSPYYIVDANAVTDDGVVLATALKSETYVDDDGEEQTREVAVSVKLNPTDGELNNCREQENKVERSGAAMGAGSLGIMALLGSLITVMRRKRNVNIKKS